MTIIQGVIEIASIHNCKMLKQLLVSVSSPVAHMLGQSPIAFMPFTTIWVHTKARLASSTWLWLSLQLVFQALDGGDDMPGGGMPDLALAPGAGGAVGSSIEKVDYSTTGNLVFVCAIQILECAMHTGRSAVAVQFGIV